MTLGINLFSTASSLVPPSTVRMALRASPTYMQNRDRAAVVAEKGLNAYDAYVAAQPALFYGSLLTAAICGYMLYKRKKIPEAVGAYSAGLIASAAVAWYTRPGLLVSTAPVAGQPAVNLMATLDSMVDKRKASDPNFADAVFARVATLPGLQEEIAADPLVGAVVS